MPYSGLQSFSCPIVIRLGFLLLIQSPPWSLSTPSLSSCIIHCHQIFLLEQRSYCLSLVNNSEQEWHTNSSYLVLQVPLPFLYPLSCNQLFSFLSVATTPSLRLADPFVVLTPRLRTLRISLFAIYHLAVVRSLLTCFHLVYPFKFCMHAQLQPEGHIAS